MLRSLPPALSENGHEVFAHKPWPELMSRYWVYEMYWKYGEGSAFFESCVRGAFPTQAQDALYSLAKLEAARAKPGEQLDDGVSPVIVGIDVAGPGKDETVVSIRCGSSVVASKAWNERRSEGAGRGRRLHRTVQASCAVHQLRLDRHRRLLSHDAGCGMLQD